MNEQLKSAAHELQKAWENYYRIYSTFNNNSTSENTPRAYGCLRELSRQLNAELTYWSSCKPKIKQLEVVMSRTAKALFNFFNFRTAWRRFAPIGGKSLFPAPNYGVISTYRALKTGVLGEEHKRFGVALTEDQLGRAFSTGNILHARGIFPSWSGTAYHGLVDLRLRSTPCWSHIEEAELISILKSIPRLRILHFGLEVWNPVPDAEQLQVVKPFSSNNNGVHSNSVLPLLAPGPKPLRLSLGGAFKLDDALNAELDGFFVRSRVTNFYAKESIPPLNLILRHSNHLECVILDKFDYQSHHKLLVE
ncbi:hypothetical protein B0J17DRAFT_632269 [Rhizoctonia solani]|nr:hypothetical protein B0J17DRAFT_632269 [Rhizoctonia solani]